MTALRRSSNCRDIGARDTAASRATARDLAQRIRALAIAIAVSTSTIASCRHPATVSTDFFMRRVRIYMRARSPWPADLDELVVAASCVISLQNGQARDWTSYRFSVCGWVVRRCRSGGRASAVWHLGAQYRRVYAFAASGFAGIRRTCAAITLSSEHPAAGARCRHAVTQIASSP